MKTILRSPNDIIVNALAPATTPNGIVPPFGLPPRGCEGGLYVRALMLAGVEHELGGKGPTKLDCWSSMQLAQWHLFDRVVETLDFEVGADGRPIIDIVSRRKAKRQWRLNKGAPRHGDVVTMAHAHEPYHVGVWLDCDRGVCLHCASFAGITVDDRGSLVASGWFNIHFYSYKGQA